MSEITIDGDWRKAASAQTQSLDEIEQAFMDQAYAAVQSKAAPIMKAPYRLGFEIVHRNDDNTRLVGIFVFRVNKDLFYSPVFFINGSIKGTDLFYRHSAKAFVPCTERWLEYLISLSETSEGVGVPISERTNTRRQLNLQSIVSPPASMYGGHKWASDNRTTLQQVADWDADQDRQLVDGVKRVGKAVHPIVHDIKDLAHKAWEGLKQSSAQSAEIEPNILRKFITEMGGYGAIKKIANTAAHDFKFASALFGGSKAENYAPDLDPITRLPEEAVLTLHTNLLTNTNVKSASTKDLHKGYLFEDKREGTNDVLIESNTHRLQAVTSPGVYEVLMADGSFSECLCGYAHELLPCDRNIPCCSDTSYPSHYSSSEFAVPIVIVEVGTGKSLELRGNKAGQVTGKFKDNITLSESEPKVGDWYRIYDMASQGFSAPILIKSKKKGDLGTSEVMFVRYESDRPTLIMLNPDFKHCDPENKVYGQSARWVPIETVSRGQGEVKYVSADDSIALGSPNALTEFFYNQGYVRGAAHKSANLDEYTLRMDCRIKNGPAYTFNKLAAITALMVEGNMVEADAEEVVKQAAENTRVLFTYKPAVMNKRAYNLRFPQFPEFYDTMNSDFNVMEQPQPTRQIVQADKDTPYIEKQRVGDRMSFDAGDNMDSATPISLYENSKQRGVSSVFEHGVVGSLINTYDSMAMLDSYMPKMQSALDCVGRTLFLFYWKPEDFAQAFGADDQTQLENKLISNFKSFGDLVIDLLQKTREHQEGSVSLT